jgi:hypothetical protein
MIEMVRTNRPASGGARNDEPHHPTNAVPPAPGGAAFVNPSTERPEGKN